MAKALNKTATNQNVVLIKSYKNIPAHKAASILLNSSNSNETILPPPEFCNWKYFKGRTRYVNSEFVNGLFKCFRIKHQTNTSRTLSYRFYKCKCSVDSIKLVICMENKCLVKF